MLILLYALIITTATITATMRAQQAALCDSALRQVHRPCCSSGTQLMFTARRGGSLLELRLDGELLETVSMPGLASAVFRQYLGAVPVSPGAKHSVVDGVVAVLAAHSSSSSSRSSSGVAAKHSSSSSSSSSSGASSGSSRGRATSATAKVTAAGITTPAAAANKQRTGAASKTAQAPFDTHNQQQQQHKFTLLVPEPAQPAYILQDESSDYGLGSIMACSLILVLLYTSWGGVTRVGYRQRLVRTASGI
jgi:hypothetical protein